MSERTAWGTGMKVEDFETLVECCNLYLKDGKLRFVPYSIKDNKRVAKILTENKMTNISLDEFNAISDQNASLYQARKKLKQQQLDKYNALVEKTGIQKTNNKDTRAVQGIHNKGYSMAKINQYRALQGRS